MPSTPTLPSLIPALKGDKGLYVSAEWDAGAAPYRKDSWLKHNNALWLALRTTSVEPSDDVPEDWFKEIDLQDISDDSEAAAASAALAQAWASQPAGEDVEGAPTGSRSALDRAAASKASADLAQAWSSQPAGEDVAGAAPGSRSAFHWAMTAANAVTAGLTSVSSAVSAGLSAISGAVSDAMDAIGLARSAALSDVGIVGTTQVGNVNTAGSTQVTAVNSAGTTQTSNVNTAGSTQAQRILDTAAAAGILYASTADALSNGILSATLGSGGSGASVAGDFDVSATNGGGTQGRIRVRVAGGSITQILNGAMPIWRGKNYTSAPTTWDFSAITGLTGATISSAISTLRPIGSFFFIAPSTQVPGALYDEYEVTAVGVATLRGTAAVSSKAAITASRIKTAVAGGAGTLSALFLPQLGLGLASPGIVDIWTDQSGNAIVADQVGHTLFSGANPKPVVVNGSDGSVEGLSMNAQTGLTIHSGVLSSTANCAIFYAVKFPAQTTYATKAAMDADTQTQGLLEEVTGDTLTTFSPDISRVVNSTYPEANLVRGLYQREWDNSNVSLRPILRARGPGSEYMDLNFNKVGQLYFSHFGSIVVDQVMSFGYTANPSLGPSAFDGKWHLIGVFIKDGLIRVAMDGYQVGAKPITGALSITTLNAFYINGVQRGANALIPVNGTRHTCGGFALLKDTNLLTFNSVYNHLSDLLGTKRWDLPKRARLVIGSGQSLGSGSTITSSDWIGPDGSIGELSTESTLSGSLVNLTREFMPNVFGQYYSTGAPPQKLHKYFGPIGIVTAGNGASSGGFGSGDGVETHDFGFAKAIISHPKWPKNDSLVFASANNGSPNTGIISAGNVVNRSSPAVRALSTIGVPIATLTVYEQMLAAVRYFADWCDEMGTAPIVSLWYDSQGFAGMTAAQMQALLVAFSADVKQITGQGVNVDGAGPQVNVSGNGLDNASSYILDQAKLDADAARGTNGVYYYCLGPNSQFSAHVHYWGRPNYRARGWIGGSLIGKAWLNGEDAHAAYPKTITRGANYVDFDYWVNRGLALVLGQTSYHTPATIQTGGIDTHGFEYSGGGLAISAMDFQNNVVTITNATAGVVTWNAHGIVEGTPVSFDNSGGALPTGLAVGNRFDKAGQVYFVINPTTNNFQVAATPGGTAINTTGTQSGTHTCYRRNRVRMSLSGAPQTGHTVSYARVNSRGGNLADNDLTVCPYPYWDTTKPVVSGRQVFADGLPVDGRQWGCHFGPLTLS